MNLSRRIHFAHVPHHATTCRTFHPVREMTITLVDLPDEIVGYTELKTGQQYDSERTRIRPKI